MIVLSIRLWFKFSRFLGLFLTNFHFELWKKLNRKRHGMLFFGCLDLSKASWTPDLIIIICKTIYKYYFSSVNTYIWKHLFQKLESKYSFSIIKQIYLYVTSIFATILLWCSWQVSFIFPIELFKRKWIQLHLINFSLWKKKF